MLKNNKEAVEKSDSLQKLGEPILTTTITVFEIWQGAEDIKNPEKKERIETLLSSIGLLDLDLESAKTAGVIHNDCYRIGKPIDPEDSMIAGIAKHHNHVILTRNLQHFNQIRGLRVEGY